MTADINQQLVSFLKEQIPQRGALAMRLTDILGIEQEAVYRRLRNEVPFTFKEVATLARTLHFSLDNLTWINGGKPTNSDSNAKPAAAPANNMRYMLQSFLPDFERIGNRVYPSHDKFFSEFQIVGAPHTSLIMTTNQLPWIVLMRSEPLYRLQLMHVMHIFYDPNSRTNFNEYLLSEKIQNHIATLSANASGIGETTFIWNRMIFSNMANLVKYYYKLGMVEKSTVLVLRDEMLKLLDDIERAAASGKSSSGTTVNFMVTDVVFKNSCVAVNSVNQHVAFEPFTGNFLLSSSAAFYQSVHGWLRGTTKAATSISVINERQRTGFFRQQRAFINELNDFVKHADADPWM